MQNQELKIQMVINQIKTLVNNVENMEYEKKLLQAVFAKLECEELSGVSLSLAECHVIDCIARNVMINTTAIANKLNITKGGISKITAKLLKKDMIEIRRLPNNQKETYFSLKPLGKRVFRVHEKLHQQAEAEFAVRFNSYSEAELGIISRFLDDLLVAFQSETLYKGAIDQQSLRS